MADTDDQEFDEAFKGFGEDDKSPTGGAEEKVPEATKEVKETEEPKEEPKKEGGEKAPEETPEDVTPETPEDNDPKEDAKPPEGPEAASTPEPTQPLTKDDVQEVVSNLLNTERSSTKELETASQEVLEAYYPDGLSNVLIDEATGKELRTPADVVAVTNGEMTIEQAASWLMDEQYKLDKSVDKIKNDARQIAETTLTFKRDAITAVKKYEPLFKAYPHLQEKVYGKLMSQVKVDKEKGVVLAAPDVLDHYDFYLEPYQLAFEHSTQQPATAPVEPEKPTETPKPSAEDRLDEGGDGGTTAPDDPNDFAQQVGKELAKPL